MSAPWIMVLVMAIGTLVLKTAGPLLLGGRAMPPRVEVVIALTVPVLLTALIAYQTFTDNGGYRLDARAIGLAVTGVGLAARLPLIVILFAAAASTALTRALA